MARSRLHTLAPDLDTALAKAPAAQRREAAWAVVRWAVECVGLAHLTIARALVSRELGDVPSVVAELDERYLALNEKGAAEAPVLAAFALARVASAVEFAARGELAEAVYEAAIGTDDVDGIRVRVTSALGRSG